MGLNLHDWYSAIPDNSKQVGANISMMECGTSANIFSYKITILINHFDSLALLCIVRIHSILPKIFDQSIDRISEKVLKYSNQDLQSDAGSKYAHRFDGSHRTGHLSNLDRQSCANPDYGDNLTIIFAVAIFGKM